MKALIVGNDYLANRFAYLLKNLTIPAERASRFSKALLKGKDFVFFSGKNCLAKDMMESLRSGCSVFSEQLLFEKRPDISLVRYAERNRLHLVIGSFDIFNPAVKEMKKLVSGERIFEMLFSRVGPKQFGYVRLNIVDDLVIQDIGIMNWILEGEPTLLAAYSRDPYNHCLAHIKIGETSVILYANKDPYYKERTAEILCEKIKIRVNILNQKVMLMKSEGIIQSLYGAGYEAYKEHIARKTEPLKEAIEQFIKGRKNPVDYHIIQKNLEVSWEIKRSLAPRLMRTS